MNELYLVAVKALLRYHKTHLSTFDGMGVYQGERIWVEPSQSASVVGRKYVYLNNSNGHLAKYNIKTGKITF